MKPADGRDVTMRLWEYAIVDQYGACRQAHAECVRWHADLSKEAAR